jgi:antitoxin component YwqK of YwqJK toxin-antitoxin module
MKKLLLIASLLCGAAAVGGAVRAMWQDSGADATVAYWSDGTKKSSIVYVDGIKAGPARHWHASGVLEAEGSYADGFKSGIWNFWNEDGAPDLERSGLYERGRRVGDSH